jgi:hypothetical protein
MKAFLTALGNKYFLWAVIALGIIGSLQMRSCQENKYEEYLTTYKRQVSGQLSDKERMLQETNRELGLAKAELVTQKELSRRLKNEKEEIDKNFEQFKKDHKLQIRSRDRTIAKLRQKINGGDSGTSVTPINNTLTIVPDKKSCEGLEDLCVISYWWEDTLKRFKLKDPNIFKKNDEVFEINQLFKIYGEVWEQKDGSLQIRRLILREVRLDGDKYLDIPDAKAEIVDSKFEYHNAPIILEEPSWTDLFKIRAIAAGTISAFPDNGNLKLGLGAEFFHWRGLGINTHTAFDFDSVDNIEQKLGISYSPNFFNLDINMAIGLSAGTPIIRFLQDYSINADLIFYINN